MQIADATGAGLSLRFKCDVNAWEMYGQAADIALAFFGRRRSRLIVLVFFQIVIDWRLSHQRQIIQIKRTLLSDKVRDFFRTRAKAERSSCGDCRRQYLDFVFMAKNDLDQLIRIARERCRTKRHMKRLAQITSQYKKITVAHATL